MRKMTPREALYYICLELGPMSTIQTNRNDNLTEREARLRDSIRALQNFIDYHDDSSLRIPSSANEYVHHDDYVPRPTNRGDGKTRIDTWKREAGVDDKKNKNNITQMRDQAEFDFRLREHVLKDH